MLFYEVKQRTLWLIPGWVTVLPGFVEDPTKLHLVVAVG